MRGLADRRTMDDPDIYGIPFVCRKAPRALIAEFRVLTSAEGDVPAGNEQGIVGNDAVHTRVPAPFERLTDEPHPPAPENNRRHRAVDIVVGVKVDLIFVHRQGIKTVGFPGAGRVRSRAEIGAVHPGKRPAPRHVGCQRQHRTVIAAVGIGGGIDDHPGRAQISGHDRDHEGADIGFNSLSAVPRSRRRILGRDVFRDFKRRRNFVLLGFDVLIERCEGCRCRSVVSLGEKDQRSGERIVELLRFCGLFFKFEELLIGCDGRSVGFLDVLDFRIELLVFLVLVFVFQRFKIRNRPCEFLSGCLQFGTEIIPFSGKGTHPERKEDSSGKKPDDDQTKAQPQSEVKR